MQRQFARRVRRNHGRRAAATVEMALAAPILLTIVFGIMQVGYAYMVQHQLQNAASKACRAAILPNRSATTVTSIVQSLLQPLNLSSCTSTTIKVNNVTASPTTAVTGDDITVQLSTPITAVTLFPNFFGNSSNTIQGAVTLRCQ